MTHPFVRTIGDALAAAGLAGAIWFSLVSVFNLVPLVGASAAGLVFAGVFAGLRRLPVETPAAVRFVPPPLEFEADELLLDQPIDSGSTVVRLFGPLATPGELHERIEQHLHGGGPIAADASEELREALAQLRRALR